jgi:hypothetical protein
VPWLGAAAPAKGGFRSSDPLRIFDVDVVVDVDVVADRDGSLPTACCDGS